MSETKKKFACTFCSETFSTDKRKERHEAECSEKLAYFEGKYEAHKQKIVLLKEEIESIKGTEKELSVKLLKCQVVNSVFRAILNHYDIPRKIFQETKKTPDGGKLLARSLVEKLVSDGVDPETFADVVEEFQGDSEDDDQ